MLLLLSLLISSAVPSDPSVTLSGDLWRALQAPEAESPEKPPGPVVSEREVRLRWEDEQLHVQVRWRVHSEKPGWFDAPLAGNELVLGSVTWNGRAAAVVSTPKGAIVTGWVAGTAWIEASGVVQQDPRTRAVGLTLMESVQSEVWVDAGEWGWCGLCFVV